MSLIKSMLVLEHEDADAPITLVISSPGGSVYAGLALVDVMQHLSCPVNTIATGMVASMASVILAAGSHRMAYAHAYVLIHQLMGSSGMAQQTDIEIVANHTTELRGVLDKLLAERGGVHGERVPRYDRARLLVQCRASARAGAYRRDPVGHAGGYGVEGAS